MNRTRTIAVVVALLLAISIATGCSGGSSKAVSITDSGFAPADLTTSVGSTLTWTNSSGAAQTVTGADFDSGALTPGATYSRTFDTAGTFDIMSRYHPSLTCRVTVR